MATPESECKDLMNAIFPFAVQMLQKYGEFYPFGAVLADNGEIVCVAEYDGREHPPPEDVICSLKNIFVEGAKSGKYKATAMFDDVKVVLPPSDQKSDAIAVSLNHVDNYSVVVFFPYRLKNKKITFGKAFAKEGEYDVFVTSE